MAKVIQKTNSGSIQLSPNFYLSEFTDSDTAVRLGIENIPDPLAVQKLFELAKLMEQVRKLLGGAIFISSGFRSTALNTAVGSGSGSDHLRGSAADFVCRSFGTPKQVTAAIAASSIKFGQLIFEGSWVHISLPDGNNDGQVLTAIFTPGQKTKYLPGIV